MHAADRRWPGRLRRPAAAGLLLVAATFALIGCKNGNSNASPGAQQTDAGLQTEVAATLEATLSPASTSLPTEPEPAPVIDACGLVTKEEVAAALGEDVLDAEAVPAGDLEVAPGLTVSVSGCSYSAGATAHYVSIDLWSASGGQANDVQSAVRTGCAGKEAAAGYGDVACWYDAEHSELQVVEGAVFLDINVSAAGDVGQIAQTVAQAALGRLP